MSKMSLSTLVEDPLGDQCVQVSLKSGRSGRSSYSYELWRDRQADNGPLTIKEAHQSFRCMS